MTQIFHAIAKSNWFNRTILGLILVSAMLSGLETYPPFSSETALGQKILTIQNIILGCFVLEIIIKIGACGSRPWQYFMSPWNVFDFLIVAVCLAPNGPQFATVLRMARLLRALRLVTILPDLQVLVNALLRAIPSLGYVGALLLLQFYIYAVMGTFLFSHNDPIRFGNLHSSMMTLFEVLTLEGWNDVYSTQALGSDVHYDEEWKVLAEGRRVSHAQPVVAAAYFVSFIMLGTMIMLNLFTGVIVSSMEDARARPAEEATVEQIESKGYITLRDELELVTLRLREISEDVNVIKTQTSQLRAVAPASSQLPDG